MEINSIIFPRPKSSYKFSDHKGELLFIPKNQKDEEQSTYSRSNNHLPDPQNFILNKWREKVEEIYKFDEIEEGVNAKKVPTKHLRTNSFQLEKMKEKCKGGFIPCMFYPHQNSNFLALYFHANSEDLGLCYNICFNLSRFLRVRYN